MKTSEFLDLEDQFPNEEERLRYIRAKERVKEMIYMPRMQICLMR